MKKNQLTVLFAPESDHVPFDNSKITSTIIII